MYMYSTPDWRAPDWRGQTHAGRSIHSQGKLLLLPLGLASVFLTSPVDLGLLLCVANNNGDEDPAVCVVSICTCVCNCVCTCT